MLSFLIMKYSNNKVFLLLYLPIIIITTLSIGRSHGQYTDCPNTTANTFASNSMFNTNLNRLLSSLSSNANQTAYGYYNTTVGSQNDTVYGLFLCRGDLTNATCQDCVSKATKKVVESCPNLKEAFMWYDNCLVRYSDQYFFGEAKNSPMFAYYNTANASELSSFSQVLGNTLKEVTAEAANSNGGDRKKYATKETNASSFETLYSLAQCTPDITAVDCQGCLEQAVSYFNGCCGGKRGGGSLTASCYFRFDLYSFYRELPSPPPPPTSPNQQNTSPPPPQLTSKGGISTGIIVAIVAAIILGLLFFFLTCCFIIRRESKEYNYSVPEENVDVPNAEFLQFDLETIKLATNNFCDDNKLGEGGFGEVFKGSLPNGQDIAVKRLSMNSTQGVEEFKNEIVLVAKLQHRNLVRLLGFSFDRQEKILIYEFVPNKSLDHFLFDPERQRELNWPTRYNIIEGIARGMLYLHEDSQLRIIHRDLKASNILLDKDLNPKIADFGTSRLFGGDQTQGITNRVVGTFGYMPPEYITQGYFSVKMDVYSFGVLVLEIISGKKNSSFHESPGGLLIHAWRKWRDGQPLELLDRSIRDCYNADEVNRCIHIGLSCVQEDPAQRPTMNKIVLMLNSHSVTLHAPERPPFLVRSTNTEPSFPMVLEAESSTTTKSVSDHAYSVDEAPITQAYPR